MPRPKYPAGYPQVFFDIVEKVSSSAKPLIYQCDTKKAAEALRFKFYSFIKACERSSEDHEQELGRAGRGLIFQISENILTISPRDHTIESYNLEDALKAYDEEEEEPSPPPRLNLVKREEVKTTSHDDVISNFLKED